jgi:hypothetical protein
MHTLNRELWATLDLVADEVRKHGRILTSSEVYGRVTSRRARRIAALSALEGLGLVRRESRNWSTGRVTELGLHTLETTAPPPARKHQPHPDVGIAPDGGTYFKRSLVEASDTTILIDGGQSAKLGRVVKKGPLRGLRMRYVTLEEGRTCPMSCALRSSCYGGNMPLAKRIVWRGQETADLITREIATAPRSLIRLHNLGDFPGLSYARKVIEALKASGSHAFGFTHHQPESTLGYALRSWARKDWARFAIRTSYLAGSRRPIARRAAVIVKDPSEAKQHDAVVCPEQLGLTDSCTTCGYCWHSQRNVAFVMHESLRQAKAA